MSEYNVRLLWERGARDFDYKTYSRKHTLFFYGGSKLEVNASANFIRNPQFYSPEELLTASLSSCFLLTFLSVCSTKGYVIDSYSDNPTCTVDEIEHKISSINLFPRVAFKNDNGPPDKKTMKYLFEMTHNLCFISNSLKVNLTVNPKRVDMD